MARRKGRKGHKKLQEEWKPPPEVFNHACKCRDEACIYNWDSEIVIQKLKDIEMLSTLKFDGYLGLEEMFSVKNICHEFFTERGWSDAEATAKMDAIEGKKTKTKSKFKVFYDAKKDKYIYEVKDKKKFRPNIKDDPTRQLQKFYRFRENEEVLKKNKKHNGKKAEEKKTKRKRKAKKPKNEHSKKEQHKNKHKKKHKKH